MPTYPATRSLSQASATSPTPLTPTSTPPIATPSPAAPVGTSTVGPLPRPEAPRPETPGALLLKLRPANITAVWTVADLERALAHAALDIEIRAHLDLTALLGHTRAAADKAEQLDALAMFQVHVATRSIRGNCNDPDATEALKLLPLAPGAPPLLPLRPFQCVLLVPDTFLAVQRGRLWLDNVYLRLQPPHRVLSSLQRPPSLVALGRPKNDYEYTASTPTDTDPNMTELHATDVTFQGHSALSMHAVRAAGVARSTSALFIGCIFTDWGGYAPPLAVNKYASARISQSLFRNMRQRAELVDVSFNGLVRFQNVSLANSLLPPEGRIVGTSMNDYHLFPALRGGLYPGVYYADDDKNYDVEVAEVHPGAGDALVGDHVIEDALMSDCLYQRYDESYPPPLPGCPQASVEKRKAISIRLRNTTAANAFHVDRYLYYDPWEPDGTGFDMFGADVPTEYDYKSASLPEADYEVVVIQAPATAAKEAGDEYIPDSYAAAAAPAPAGYDAMAPRVYGGDSPFSVHVGDYWVRVVQVGYTYPYDLSYGYQDEFPLPPMATRLELLQQEQHPWFAGAQRVLPTRPPPPPSWPAINIPTAEGDAATAPAEITPPFSNASTTALPILPDTSADSPVRAPKSDWVTAVAVCVAAAVAAVTCIRTCMVHLCRKSVSKLAGNSAMCNEHSESGGGSQQNPEDEQDEPARSAVKHACVPLSAMNPDYEFVLPAHLALVMRGPLHTTQCEQAQETATNAAEKPCLGAEMGESMYVPHGVGCGSSDGRKHVTDRSLIMKRRLAIYSCSDGLLVQTAALSSTIASCTSHACERQRRACTAPVRVGSAARLLADVASQDAATEEQGGTTVLSPFDSTPHSTQRSYDVRSVNPDAMTSGGLNGGTQAVGPGGAAPGLACGTSASQDLSNCTPAHGHMHEQTCAAAGKRLQGHKRIEAAERRGARGTGADRDLQSRAVDAARRRLQRQLDSFREGDRLLGRFEMLGRQHRRNGGQATVQFAEDRDYNAFAVKFFLDWDSFHTEATLYAAAFPHIRSIAFANGLASAGASAVARDISKVVPMAEAVARFLPQVEAVCDGAAGGLEDPCGRPLPPCIVMEKGESLHDWSDRAEPDLFMALAVLSNLSLRLADMHDAGYVHRDLKPANVMWLPRQNRWTVIDFGCVARVGEMAPLNFTLAYAAPEVAGAVCQQERNIEVRPALDAWSLGVMAYELLTRAPAFDMLSDGPEGVLRRLLGERPLPWEDELSTDVRSRLGPFKGAVLQLLQREAAARMSMREFHDTCATLFAVRTAADLRL